MQQLAAAVGETTILLSPTSLANPLGRSDLGALITKLAFANTGELACATKDGSVWVWADAQKLNDKVLAVEPSAVRALFVRLVDCY